MINTHRGNDISNWKLLLTRNEQIEDLLCCHFRKMKIGFSLALLCSTVQIITFSINIKNLLRQWRFTGNPVPVRMMSSFYISLCNFLQSLNQECSAARTWDKTSAAPRHESTRYPKTASESLPALQPTFDAVRRRLFDCLTSLQHRTLMYRAASGFHRGRSTRRQRSTQHTMYEPLCRRWALIMSVGSKNRRRKHRVSSQAFQAQTSGGFSVENLLRTPAGHVYKTIC